MRQLTQPGPAATRRIDSVADDAASLLYRLQPGLSLNAALTGPLVEAGMQCAALEITGGAFAPFAYVVPALPRGTPHVAYFSTPRSPAGTTRLDFATATFGWRDGAPFVHCHGGWTEADGGARGGHVLAHETTVVVPAEVRAFALPRVRIEATPDPETLFTLFAPRPDRGGAGRMVFARIRPNQDILTALEKICARHSIAEAVVRGSLGSLVGARFRDGRAIGGAATEVFVHHGTVRTDGDRRVAELEMSVVDMDGTVHRGWLSPGDNPVCITFELMLERLR